MRLVRAGVSARWIGDKCLEWGEDVVRLQFSYRWILADGS